jgi:hypothetical protein
MRRDLMRLETRQREYFPQLYFCRAVFTVPKSMGSHLWGFNEESDFRGLQCKEFKGTGD